MADLIAMKDNDLQYRKPRTLVGAVTILVTALITIACVGYAPGAESVFRGSDGSIGFITHLGDDEAIYRDAHGTTGPIRRPGGQGSPTIITPQGEIRSGTVTPFGTPTPPNQLTAPPVLSINPHLGAVPNSPAPPVIPLSPPLGNLGTGRR
jgi:hypothetical protein